MELNGLLPVLRRWVLVIVVATAVAALIGWRFSASADEGYESSAVALVGPLNTDSDTMRASSALAQTYAELATSESLLARVAEATGVPAADLEDGVRATANGTTRFLTVTARADAAETARAVAEAVVADLIGQSREGAVRPEGQLRLIDPASAPERPVTPRGDLVIPLAALAGLLGSAAIVLLYELVSDAAETGARVEEATGVPALVVARRRGWSWRRHPDPLRVAATQVELSGPAMRCVVVGGAVDRDGSAGLALALARIWGERRPVTVLDATGTALVTWGADDGDGLATAAITEEAARALVAEHTADGGLLIVVTGSALTSTAALVWAHVADVTLLGVRRSTTRLAHVRDAAGNLRATGAEIPFVLLHDGHLPTDADLPAPRRPEPRAEASPARPAPVPRRKAPAKAATG
ncbi:MAG TPA: hypothetical protein VFU19_03105 [Iamia sp.]|nr:hypothetical protein [Iamia sp.]